MKSSSALSAQWMSSKTSTVGPCSASRSKKIRQAAKRFSRSPRRALLEAEQVREPRLDEAPLLRVRNVLLDGARGASRGARRRPRPRRCRRAPRTISASAQNATPSP